MKKHPASIPRKMFWPTDAGGLLHCPQCGGRLENEHHTYVFATREREEFDTFIVGNKSGYFCEQCPVVVLDYDSIVEILSFSRGCAGTFEFVAMGIVDLEAIPDEKKDDELGTDDNPVPLVEFTNIEQDSLPRRVRSRQPSRSRPTGRRKNRRK